MGASGYGACLELGGAAIAPHGGVADFLIRLGTDRRVRPRLGGRRQIGLLDLFQQHREGAVEDRARIAVGDLSAEKPLQPPPPSPFKLEPA
jgi:hypothetical protein